MPIQSWRQDLQDEISSVALEMAQEFGEQVTYTHRGTATKVYAIVYNEGEATNKVWANTRVRELPKTFEIPVQAGFPPSDLPFPGDTITDEVGDLYVVETWKADDVRAVFTFRDCKNSKAKTTGTVG